jgi:voltage-gated potassium channel
MLKIGKVIKRLSNTSIMNIKLLYITMINFGIILIMAIIITLFFDVNDFNGKQYSGITFNSFIENFYYSTITISTIGYGDIYPITQRARIIVTIMSIYSIMLLTTLL